MLEIWRSIHVLVMRVRSVFGRKHVERELEEEFEHYIEERTAQEVARGLSPAAAREIALRALEGRTQQMESCRDARGLNLVENLLRDLRHGFRSWRRTPGVWTLAILALGLGIGANSMIFSLVDVVFHRPLAGLDPSRHVVLKATHERLGHNGNSLEDFLAWRRSGAFELLVATRPVERVLIGGGEPERISGQLISPDLFRLFPARPALGRYPTEEEYRQGSNAVLVLSHNAWLNRFQGRTDIAGKTIRLDDAEYTIIGVAPRGFWFPDARAAFWTPIRLESSPTSDSDRAFNVLGRLTEGATRTRAAAVLHPVSLELERRFPASHTGWRVQIQTLFEGFYGQDDDKTIYLLYIISGGVLLICCGNVANLLLSRGLGRAHEMSVRAALGAGQWRIFGQTLTEGLLLAIPGSLVALAIAESSAGLALHSLEVPFPIPLHFIDARVLAFNGLAALLSILVFGLYPAFIASRQQASLEGKAGRRATSGGPGSSRFAAALVALQTSFSLALVIAAVVAVRGAQIIFALHPGYDNSNVIRAEFEPSKSRYAEQADYQRFFERLTAAVQAGPPAAIESAGLITSIPGGLRGDGTPSSITTARRKLALQEQPLARYIVATPGAIEALRVPILRGRPIEETDRFGTQRVAIVNQKLCDQLFPGIDAIGEGVVVDGLGDEPFRIVGIYPNLLRVNIKAPPAPQLFVPYLQAPRRSAVLVVRAANTAVATEFVRSALRSIDPEEPVEISTLRADQENGSKNGLVFVQLIAALAGLALFLGGCGLFALLSQTVTQRLPEIGVRMALGASTGSVQRMIVYSGLRLVAMGGVVGVAGGILIGKLVASQMVHIAPTDGGVLGPAVGTFLVVAAAACLAPARRAVRTEVLAVLREE
jgi:putative ABC transport system permease protein